jgi:uncharacterized protein YbjT (DUF2867 family)
MYLLYKSNQTGFTVGMAKILTYGSTGSQGSPVAHHLLAAGHHVRIVVRDTGKAADVARAGAEVFSGDLADPASLADPSNGVDAVFLMIPLGAPGDPIELATNAIDAAKRGGAKLLVFLASGHTPSAPTGIPMFDFRTMIENLIAGSAVPSIILRPGVYMENFLGPWCLPSVRHANAVAYPHREEMSASWITSQDIGALVTAAITRPELAGKRYTIGGPEALSGKQIAEAFTNGLQRPITYSAIDPTDFGNTMAQFMGPEIGMGLGAAYAWQNDQPADATAVDMSSVLRELPVQLTRLEDWVRSNQHFFQSDTA